MRTTILYIFFLLVAKIAVAQDDSDINPLRLTDTTFIRDLLADAQKSASHKEKNRLTEQALDLSRKQNYAYGVTASLAILNEAYRKGDDSFKALTYALEEMHGAKNDKNTERYNRMALLVARIYLDYGSYAKALDYFNVGMKNDASSDHEKATLYELMGDAYAGNNQHVEANQFYNKSVDFLNNYKEEQRVFQKITTVYLAAKEPEQAILTLNFIKEKAQKNNQKIDIAIASNNIASIYHQQKKYAQAIPFFEEALENKKQLNAATLSVLCSNLGIAYQNTGDNNRAIQLLNKAITYSKSSNNIQEEILILNLLANIYLTQKDFFNAQKYNRDAEKKNLDKVPIATKAEVFRTAALIHQQLYEYEKAFEYYQKFLELKDNLLLDERASQQDLQRQIFLLEKQEKELQLRLINDDVRELNFKQERLEKQAIALKAAKQEDELNLLKQSQQVTATTLKNKELEALRAKQELDLANQHLAAAEKDKSLADLKQKEQLQLEQLARQRAETQQNLQAISLLTKDKDLLTANNELLSKDASIKELELEGQRSFKRTAYGIGLLLLAITALIIRGLRQARRNNTLLSQKNKEIEASQKETEIERQKAEKLLLNILPDETAAELKAYGMAIPRHYDKVSVLFTDFSNFTKISAKMSPEELISELNECFVAFDEIVEKHGLEKIKTIGDAYMCAGGIPTANDTNPKDAVAAALDLQAFMQQRNQQKEAIGQPYFQMRVGIHTGEVITGVVGKNKFAYDIWGDTVNLASRMESTSPPGAVNISEATYQLVKGSFRCTPRGEMEVKGKGKVAMYLVG